MATMTCLCADFSRLILILVSLCVIGICIVQLDWLNKIFEASGTHGYDDLFVLILQD